MADAVRPNFFVIGASKCGTSALCELLANHRDVFITTPKEPLYFSRSDELGLTPEWYASLFRDAGGYAAIGDGSTNYACVGLFPGVEKRVAAYSPDARIIYIVRHPLERMESQWVQRRSAGTVSCGFAEAVRDVPEMIESNLYWKNINAYRQLFDDDRILVLFFEEFRADPPEVVARCFEFLGLGPADKLDDPRRPRNVRASKREDRILMRSLRRIPGFERTRDALVPQNLRPYIRRFFTQPVADQPEWDAETRRWAVDQIAEDCRTFLEHCGKPADFWKLD